MEEEIEPKITIDKGALRRMKVNVAISLSVEEWEGFILHAEKTGGALSRKIADVVAPKIAQVKKAIADL